MKIKKNYYLESVFWGMLSKFVPMLLTFFIRRIIIDRLGTEYLGLDSFFTSVLNILNLSEMGFSTVIVCKMYKYTVEKNTIQLCKLLSFFRTIYRYIGSFILIIGLAVMPFLRFFIHEETAGNIYFFYFIYLLGVVFSYFFYAYKEAILLSQQKVGENYKIYFVSSIVTKAFQIILLIFTCNYFFYCLSNIVGVILRNYLIHKVTIDLFPQYVCKGKLNNGEMRLLVKDAVAVLGHKIGGVIVGSSDNIIIMTFLGLNILGIYNNYYFIISALMTVIGIFAQTILPKIGTGIVINETERNYTAFLFLSFVFTWIVGWMSICYVCLIQDFMIVWVGEVYLLNMKTVLLLSIYFFSWQFRVFAENYKGAAAGYWKADALKPYVASLVDITLNILFVQLIGLDGVIISTIICMFFVFFPWETWVIFKKIFKRSSKEYIFKMFRWTFSIFIAGVITVGICYIPDSEGIRNLLLKVPICVIVPNLVIFIFSYIISKDEIMCILQKSIYILRKKK